jgi:O-antigen/teichoic acid export membrane protein
MPKAVKAWREGGGSALRRQTMCDGIILGVLTSAFGVFAWFFAEDVMALLYPGSAYQGLGATVATLAAALAAAALGLPPANALASMERLRPLVVAGLIGAGLTAALVTLLGWGSGLLGIACGVFAGHAAGSVARWTALLSATRGGADQARRAFPQVLPL